MGLRELLEAATPGPWAVHEGEPASLAQGGAYLVVPRCEADDRLVALAPDAIQLLIDMAAAVDVPLLLECITEPPCGDCPGCRLRALLARFAELDRRAAQ